MIGPLPTKKYVPEMLYAPCSTIIQEIDLGVIARGIDHCFEQKLSFAWYSLIEKDIEPPDSKVFFTRAIAGKPSFDVCPGMSGREISTTGLTKVFTDP